MPSDESHQRTRIIGLGNDIRGDDGVGLEVVRRLVPLLEDRGRVEVVELPWGGLRLMENLIGCSRAIIVDAMLSGADHGSLRWLSPEGIPTQHGASSHDVDLPTALELGRTSGAQLPRNDQLFILGIEVSDVQTYSQTLTPAVEAAVPLAVEAVLKMLEELTGSSPS
jgi:hydrogenase maturation protease